MSTKAQKNTSAQGNKATITVSIRILGKSTSVSLRKNIVSLWILMKDIPNKKIDDTLNSFVYNCSDVWCKEGNENAKGFSDFILRCMISEFLEDEDFQRYKQIYNSI